jgi:hypothetical protein
MIASASPSTGFLFTANILVVEVEFGSSEGKVVVSERLDVKTDVGSGLELAEGSVCDGISAGGAGCD